ncbi:MAG: hypothetical protein KC944_19730, partial [Candidatus Omnitrophica bacterium]|nr:hypothetical protein [Candidatus Omnitrophota bacterium]
MHTSTLKLFITIAIASLPLQGWAQESLLTQTPAQAQAKSQSCLLCHSGVEKMHKSQAVVLGCVDCHGGNPTTDLIQAPPEGSADYQWLMNQSHVHPRVPGMWRGSSKNPEGLHAEYLDESKEFIRFVNPGDLRVADISCGECHPKYVYNVQKSIMTTGAHLWGSAAYNNGIIRNKNYILGESYGPDGEPRQVNTVPAPGPEELLAGVLPTLLPLPRWEISQPGDIFRAFERGGKINRLFVTDPVGNPNPFEEPGKPDNRLGDRGLGTQLNISVPVLNIHKTRLNDPFLHFPGTNDHPGDYRHSGCTACHVVYANDRSYIGSGPYAEFGNSGHSYSNDPTIPKGESGHPIKHQFTNSIPNSQCMTCHHHQPNSFVNTYLGFQMWDYETDGKPFYPEFTRDPTEIEKWLVAQHNPEGAAARGKWKSKDFLKTAANINPELKHTQMADYHGHGWMFRGAFKKDRKGNLLDKDGNIVPFDDPNKFDGVYKLAGDGSEYSVPEKLEAHKAVHLKDIHLEHGMHCVDCHFEQDVHGDGNLYGEYQNAIEIKCQDCHGDVDNYSDLRTSGPAAPEGGNDLRRGSTPFGKPRFQVREDNVLIQNSMMYEDLSWEVTQVRDMIDPSSPHFNEKAAYAKTIQKDNKTWGIQTGEKCQNLAHSMQKMECYTCHTSWVTSCFGCHLPAEANWQMPMNHFEGGKSRTYTTYNPQVVRDDIFMLGVAGTVKGNKIAPVRSSSALVLSNKNQNREKLYIQQPPISAPGYSSQAFNTHFAHSVRTAETMQCDDCHVSESNDNNAWLAQTYTLGTNFVNFMGRYAWVGTGEGGPVAVQVTEWDEPQAVYGSYLHKLAFSDRYNELQMRGKELEVAYEHHGEIGGALGIKHDTRSLVLYGQYLLTASGHEGLRGYDVANIDNKGFSERFVTDPSSPLGHNIQVDTLCATGIALGTNMPLAFDRKNYPENQEQWPIHPLYRYAYVSDSVEGLVVVNIETLTDRDPLNNFLKKCRSFNPDGILRGANHIEIAGNYAYLTCNAGLVIVGIDNPLQPYVAAVVGNDVLTQPTGVCIQFRYAFVTDAQGLKVIEITNPQAPVYRSTVEIHDARNVYVSRTYAYVAAGHEGIAIVDVEKPEEPFIQQMYNAEGKLHDTYDIKVASTNASLFAYVADGMHGFKVIQLTSPESVPGNYGFSPTPNPQLIATHHTHEPALAVAEGLERDRAVDESGNQVSIFGRLGGRPLNLEEMQKLYLTQEGKVFKVKNEPDSAPIE